MAAFNPERAIDIHLDLDPVQAQHDFLFRARHVSLTEFWGK